MGDSLGSLHLSHAGIRAMETCADDAGYMRDANGKEAKRSGVTTGHFRVVSPYLFAAQYEDEEGNVFFDGAKEMVRVLDEYPGLSLEIVSHSVLTS